MEEKKNLITVNIDGHDLEVPSGTNMVEAAALLGKEIPHYCYHPKLSIAGNCRMCLVELGMPGRDRATGEAMLNEDGQPDSSLFVDDNLHINADGYKIWTSIVRKELSNYFDL